MIRRTSFSPCTSGRTPTPTRPESQVSLDGCETWARRRSTSVSSRGARPTCTTCIRRSWRPRSVLLESDLARTLDHKGMPLAHMKADVLLAIGGDGTILRALQLSDSKVLGINSGSLGFLAEVDANEAPEYLDRIVRGDYRIEERMRIKVTVDGERLFACANEAVGHTAQIA